jgi:N-dimethylarginine dimethylaminohydrolase
VVLRRPPADCSQWRALGWRAEPDAAALAAEHEALCTLIEDAGAEVLVAEADGLDAIYTYDTAIVGDDGAVLARPGKAPRRSEPDRMAAELERAGAPVVGAVAGPGIAEGGDFFWLDATTLCAGRGYRTSASGIAAVGELLGVAVLGFDLPHRGGPGECLHLLSLISPLADDLAVVHLPLLPVALVQTLAERGVSLVEADPGELSTLGPNVLALEPRLALLPEHNRETRRALESAGVETLVYRADELSKGDGGPTCLTLPLLRG